MDFAEANREIAERMIEAYTKEEIDSVYLIYNEFKSVIAQRAGGGADSSDRGDWRRRA